MARPLGGRRVRRLHKHVDTLRAEGDDNPLRWRLAVSDDLTGVGAADIRAVLRPGGVEPGYELAVSPAAGLAGDAGRMFDIVAPGHIPELAQVEGRFELEIQARDRLENLAAPVVGCWQHVPLAAPVHQAPLALASGAGSFAAANLDNDDVATLLRGAEDRVIAQPLPALTEGSAFLSLRVVDTQSGQVVACDRHQLVGIVDEVGHVVCADPDQAAGNCRGHRVFDLYQALTDARIDIQTVRVSARTAPGPSLPPRMPRPATSGSDGTFSTPVSTTYEWSAAEPRIPSEGGL